jgi:epoxide hydrolase
MSIQPFTISIPQSTMDDLRERSARTRWIVEVESSSWEHGISLEYLKELTDYWLDYRSRGMVGQLCR